MKNKIYNCIFYFVMALCCVAVINISSAWAELDNIEAAIMKKDYSFAKQSAEQYLNSQTDKNRDYYQAQYYLAISNLNLNDYPGARTLFREIVQANPEPALHDRAYIGMFNSYYLQGDYEQALDITQRLLDANPDSEFLSLIHLKIAQANLKLAKWSKARTHLRIIVSNFPDSFERFTADKLLQEKQYFTVQVGAFIEREKAEQLVRSLKAANDYVYILESKDLADIIFYRVRVGKMAKLNEAQSLSKKLADQGYPAIIYP